MRWWQVAAVPTVFVIAQVTAGAAPLVEAAKHHDRAAFTALLGGKADVDAVAGDGTTALHWAVHHADADMVRHLVKAGADVRRANRYGATPMSEAAVAGNVDIIRMLLDAGADVESPNADGQTALMIVARTSNVEAASLLIGRGADVNARETWREQTALMWAAAQSQPQMLRLLLRHGADPDARSAVNRWERLVSAEPRVHFRKPGGWTALLYAARQGCAECARVLLEGGADPDIADPEGVTPLLLSLVNLHFDFAHAMLDGGANPDKWDWRGRTPLYVAVDMNMLPEGGWPDRPSRDATAPLEVARALLEKGANPNPRLKLYQLGRSLKDDRGRDLLLSIGATPLLRAAKTFDVPAIELLLAHGADPDLPNEGLITPAQIGGITPLMAAAGLGSRVGDARGKYDTPDVQQRSIAALRVLIRSGADINARDAHGRTALHSAAFWGWKDVVSFLVDSGADPRAADADGMLPIDAARGKMKEGRFGSAALGKGHEEVVALLERLMAPPAA